MPPPISHDDSNFRRAEDQQFKERTNERIVALTASEGQQNDRLDEIDEELVAIHEIVDGKANDRDDNGLKGELKDLNRSYNELRALMMPDHLGHGGIINRLKALERNAGIEETRTEHFWKFWTAIGVALISLVGLLVSNWDKVSAFLSSKNRDPVSEIIHKAKHPKGRQIRKQVIKYVPEAPIPSPNVE